MFSRFETLLDVMHRYRNTRLFTCIVLEEHFVVIKYVKTVVMWQLLTVSLPDRKKYNTTLAAMLRNHFTFGKSL